MNRNYTHVFFLVLASCFLVSCGSQKENQALKIPVETIYKMNEKECLAAGNKWQQQGLMKSFICIRVYSDGGKICAATSECEGDCIATSDNKTVGNCSVSSSRFGCSQTIEDARAGKPVLCID